MKALVTAEVNREVLERGLSGKVDFTYDGYFLNHDVMPHKELVERVKGYDILICEYDTVDEAVFNAADKLKLLICCRGGVKSVVDLDRAKEKGVTVCNNAGRNAGAVTDIAMGFIIDLTRNITKTSNLIHNRILTADKSTKPEEYADTVWGLDGKSPFIMYRGHSICHMTLGIVGYGHAGKLMAEKAHAFGMKILIYSPHAESAEKPDYVRVAGWQELLQESDVISVHCSLTPQTKDMFSSREFSRMKPGAYFINTARGECVVEEDLVAALRSGQLGGAALDVTRKEPVSADSILVGAPNLIVTPHIAGSADDVQFCGTNMVLESLRDYLEGRKPRNCVV